MDLQDYFTIASAGSALLGGCFLAFALGRALWEISFSIQAISLSIESIASKGDIYVYRGLEARLKRAVRRGAWFTWIGVGLLFFSFAFSVTSLVVKAGS